MVGGSDVDLYTIPFLESLADQGRSLLSLNGACQSAESIARCAESQRVQGLVYRDCVGRYNPPFVSVAELLRETVLSQLSDAAAKRQKFSKLLEKAADRGVRFVLLKGIALTEYVYRDCGYRQMRDIDVLVRDTDLDAAYAVAQDMHMQPISPPELMKADSAECQAGWFLGARTEYSKELVVEMHWNIVPPHSPFCISASDLWQDVQMCQFDGIPAYVLSPQHNLIHMCIHWHYHGYRQRLRDMFDLYALIMGHAELDWRALSSCAQRWKAESVVYLALSEMSRYFCLGNDICQQIRSLAPVDLRQRFFVLPALKRCIAKEDGKKKANSVAAIILTLGGGRKSGIISRLLPSKQRLLCQGYQPSTMRLKHYVHYYVDLLRRFIRGLH